MFRSLLGLSAVLAAFLLFECPAFAGRLGSDNLVSASVTRFSDMMKDGETAIPDDILQKCLGVAIFPEMRRFGLGIGSLQAFGLVMARDLKGGWQGPAFFRVRTMYTGLTVQSRSSIFTVIVIMDKRGLKAFTRDDFGVGVDASVAVGPLGSAGNRALEKEAPADLLTYTLVDKKIYPDVMVAGGRMVFMEDETARFHGRDFKAYEILGDGAAGLPEAAKPLADALEKAAGRQGVSEAKVR
jgi:lipid-binding SYLF domain-containing protein